MATKPSKGSVLILALWSLSLLTTFAVSLSYMVRQKVTLLDRIEKRQHLWNAAWSGVERARSAVQEDVDAAVDTFQDSWANNPQFRSIRFERARLSIQMTDEQGKLNLNVAEPSAISILLRQVTDMDTEEADQLAFAIVDWRDGDSAYGHPDFGAEDGDYDNLPRPYEAKDLPYQSVDELLLVKGMNHAIFEKVKPFVTLFGSGAVNINMTDVRVLAALGLPIAAAQKVILHRDGPDGRPATFDDRPFTRLDSVASDMDQDKPPPDGLERAAIQTLVDSAKIGMNTEFFGISSRAESVDGKAFWLIEAVASRKGDVVYSHSSGTQWNTPVAVKA